MCVAPARLVSEAGRMIHSSFGKRIAVRRNVSESTCPLAQASAGLLGTCLLLMMRVHVLYFGQTAGARNEAKVTGFCLNQKHQQR